MPDPAKPDPAHPDPASPGPSEPGDDARDPLEDTVEMAAIRWDADDEATDADDTATTSAETDDTEADDSETDDSETDDSETDDSETDDSETDDSGADDTADDTAERRSDETDTPATTAPSLAKAPRKVAASDGEAPSEADAAAGTRPESKAAEAPSAKSPATKSPSAKSPSAQERGDRPAARTSTPARDRLVTALLKPSRRQVVVAVLLGLLGFAAVTQVRANEVDDSYAGLRQQDLIDTLNNLSNAERRADAEISRLQQDKEELENSTNRREAAIAQAKQLTDTLDILAGVVPVTGPGLRITIEETDQEIDIDTMIDTVQELRNAGAESMEFNDEVRVVAQTSLQQAVGGIEIDGTLLEPPYVIDVIGDPDTLESSGMRFPTGPLEQLSDDKATTTIDRSGDIEIASVVEERKAAHLEQE